VESEGQVDKNADLGFWIFLVPMYVSFEEKAFFSPESGAKSPGVFFDLKISKGGPLQS
jgi:hypothetical protein